MKSIYDKKCFKKDYLLSRKLAFKEDVEENISLIFLEMNKNFSKGHIKYINLKNIYVHI